MSEPLRRGALFFTRCGRDESNVLCTYGQPGEPESEHVFELHESYIDDVIAGLTAMKATRRKG